MTQRSSLCGQAFQQAVIADPLFQAMQAGNTFHEEQSPVPRERLRLLTVQHVDFEGNTQTGQLVMLDVCAAEVLALFQALYKRRFPIARMRLMHYYNGNDIDSMTDNNTSGYNCRFINNSKKISLHAYGAAIDINPVQNPCVYIDREAATTTYEPASGIQYANRRLERLEKNYRKGMAEEVVEIFAQHGFYWWGGDWDTPLDYHHFQLSRSMAELYAVMEPTAAQAAFHQTTHYFNQHKRPLELALSQRLEKDFKKEGALAEYYQENPRQFNRVFQQLTSS
ncbi:MAG: M15 family metallopeptidase [Bacteroidota bacterium]